MIKQIHIIISGMVQGVWFRATTKEVADSLGLKGFVRNIEDGVEIVAVGDESKIKEFIEFAKKGPKGAKVTNVKISYPKIKESFKEFEIRRNQ